MRVCNLFSTSVLLYILLLHLVIVSVTSKTGLCRGEWFFLTARYAKMLMSCPVHFAPFIVHQQKYHMLGVRFVFLLFDLTCGTKEHVKYKIVFENNKRFRFKNAGFLFPKRFDFICKRQAFVFSVLRSLLLGSDVKQSFGCF
jgi:hypothetical protein